MADSGAGEAGALESKPTPAHADAGSFVLLHRGRPLLVDSGACTLELPQYPDYYVQSHAHDIARFDGEGQLAEDHDRA